MKKRNLQRIFAAFMATAMAVTAAGCSSEGGAETTPTPDAGSTTTQTPDTNKPADNGGDTTTPAPAVDIPDDEFYAVLDSTGTYVDKNGNKIDLGGLHVVVRDWFSSGRKTENLTEYDQAQYAYWDEMQTKYNFTIESTTIGDWGSVPQDFIDYATNPDDGNAYVFTLRGCAEVTSAMANGLMYDLSTLHALDFSSEKFQANMLHDQYSLKGKPYCMFAGTAEPRTGVYFNKKVLKDANIDFNEIYDLQKNGQWTWAKFEEYCAKIQRDTDGDGVDNIFAFGCNEGAATTTIVASNGGSLIGKSSDGSFYFNADSAETLEALEWAKKMYVTYHRHATKPEDAQWNYYQDEFKSGVVGFLIEDEYAGMGGNFLKDCDFEYGFVMFPVGPKGKEMINVWSNNPVCIPANYDKMKAGQIAFAWSLYTDTVPDWEDYDARLVDAQLNGHFDDRAKSETIPMMIEQKHATVDYGAVIPDLATSDILWHINENEDVSAVVEGVKDAWQAKIDAANK